MWYLIGVVVMVLAGFFVYANIRKNEKPVDSAKTADKPFRTEEDLSTYGKPLDDKHSHVDFDDAE